MNEVPVTLSYYPPQIVNLKQPEVNDIFGKFY